MAVDSFVANSVLPRVVIAARAAGILPLGFIGTVADFKDLDAFRATIKRSRRLGFMGASVIHPSQIQILNEEFRPTADEVADATVGVLRRVVPVALPGIAFLSGGQSGVLASERLNAMNSRFKTPSAAAPWALTFSFARAIQQPALEIWAGKDTNREAAQHALLHRAQCNRAARQGLYTRLMESTPPRDSEAA